MHLRQLLCILLISFAVHTAVAQEATKKAEVPISSPTAASLGKFVDVPVNNHTGIPNINIPIYSIQEGPLQLPISLSYHAGGLKVGEVSSWVGAGWALNAGGVVSRTIRGAYADERSKSNYSYLKDGGYMSYLYDNSGLSASFEAFATGSRDGEPDLYFFNFGGYTGKFYLREDGQPKQIPHQDIKIEPVFCDSNVMDCNSNYEKIAGWKFSIPDGTKYYFGIAKAADNVPGAKAAESSESLFFDNNDGCYSYGLSSWYLYKVESADNNFNIKLTYEAEVYGYYTVGMGKVDDAGTNSLVKNIIHGARLSKITFSNGEVNFIPSDSFREDLSGILLCDMMDRANTSAKSLSKIEISSTVSGVKTCKGLFTLNTGYFVDNKNLFKGWVDHYFSRWEVQSDKKRLKLISIQESSCESTPIIKKPATTFTYYDEDIDGAVPRTLLFSVDHWGFNNGAVNNESLVPALSVDGGKTFGWANAEKGVLVADRESKWPAMRSGTLKSIKYPTGGFTEFIYGTDSIAAPVYIPPDTLWTNVGSYSCGFGGPGRCPTDASQYLHQFTVGEDEIYKLIVKSVLSGSVYGSGYFRIVNASGQLYSEISVSNGEVKQQLYNNLQVGTNYYIYGEESTTNYGSGISLEFHKGNVTPETGVRLLTEITDPINPLTCGMGGSGGRCPSEDPSQNLYQFIVDEDDAYQLQVVSVSGVAGGKTYYGSGVIRVKDVNGSIYEELAVKDGETVVKILNLRAGKIYYLDGETDKVVLPAGTEPPYGAGIKIKVFKGQWFNRGFKYYTIGGLRIEKINYKSEAGDVLKTTQYEYPSGAALFSIPRYIFKVKNKYKEIYGLIDGESGIITRYGCASDGGEGGPIRFGTSNSSVHPMQNTQGSHKGYETVKVLSPENSYSIYHYNVSGIPPMPFYGGVSYREIDNRTCFSYEADYPPAPAEHHFERSSLVHEKHYNKADGLLKEVNYKSLYEQDLYGGHGLKVAKLPSNISGDWTLSVFYQTKSARKIYEKRVEKTYSASNQANVIVKKYETHYNDPIHTFPTVSAIYDGEASTAQKLEETIHSYIKDLDPCARVCTECKTSLTVALQNAKVNYQEHLAAADRGDLSKWDTMYCQDAEITRAYENANAYKRCAFINYQWEINNARKAYVVCLKDPTKCAVPSDCLPNAYNVATDPKLKAVLALLEQHQVQQPLEISSWKGDKLLSSQFFEYSSKDEISKNAYLSKVHVLKPEQPLEKTSYTPAWATSTTLNKDRAYEQEGSYRYEGGNLVEILGRDGVRTSFIYKDNLPIVKAVGIGYDELLAVYTAVSSDSNYNIVIRSHEKTKGAFVSTYTYNPLVGMLTQADATGQTIYYEYDEKGRLLRILDNNKNILQQNEYKYASE